MSNNIEGIKKFYQKSNSDTGSIAIQVIYQEMNIKKIKEHLLKNKWDVPAKRSLLRRISKKSRDVSYIIKKKGKDFAEKLNIDINNCFYKY